MADLNLAHEVDGGLILDDGAGVFHDTFDPTVTGFGAAEGSLFLRSTGQVYRKTGAGDTDWTEMDTAGAAIGQLSKFTANDAIFRGAAPAGAKGRNSHAILIFDDTTEESVVFEDTMSKDYSSGNLTVKILWAADTAVTGVVGWRAFFENMSGLDIDADGFAAAQLASDTTAATAGIYVVTSIAFTQAQADGIAPEDAFRLKVERNTGVGSNMTGDAHVLRVTVTQ